MVMEERSGHVVERGPQGQMEIVWEVTEFIWRGWKAGREEAEKFCPHKMNQLQDLLSAQKKELPCVFSNKN